MLLNVLTHLSVYFFYLDNWEVPDTEDTNLAILFICEQFH